MSRYMLNKLMYEVDLSDEAVAALREDPVAFLERWQRLPESPTPPWPQGGSLSEEEAAAIANLDFGAIYAMGAHPFLLWQFARSVCVPDQMTNAELIVAFRIATEPHGSPDFST